MTGFSNGDQIQQFCPSLKQHNHGDNMTDSIYEINDAASLQLFLGTSKKTVATANPGFLITLNNLNPIFKTEYSEQTPEGDLIPICYNCAGERWCGSINTPCIEVVVQ